MRVLVVVAREQLLANLKEAEDIKQLECLAREELLSTYCERLVYGVMQRAPGNQPAMSPSGSIVGVLVESLSFRANFHDANAPIYVLPVISPTRPVIYALRDALGMNWQPAWHDKELERARGYREANREACHRPAFSGSDSAAPGFDSGALDDVSALMDPAQNYRLVKSTPSKSLWNCSSTF